LERAFVTTAEPGKAHPYQAVDTDVIDELDRLLKKDGNGKSIIGGITTETAITNLQNEVAKLKIGDFVFF
jgi:hypothetical protein